MCRGHERRRALSIFESDRQSGRNSGAGMRYNQRDGRCQYRQAKVGEVKVFLSVLKQDH